MLIQEFKYQLEEGKSIEEIIKIKPYISFLEKKLLCLNVLENCMDLDNNSMVVCDFFLRKLVRDINIVKQYSNVEISDDGYVSEYDFLVENKVFDFIIDNIAESELDFIDEMIEREAEQRMKVSNSVEGILSKNLQALIEKIPDEKGMKKLINDIPKTINKIKPENLEILRGVMNKQIN